ncbi:AAA ATPase-like protein [Rathayibacter sp. PhB152]|uniref:ATP-binding protein n=1 Tax=Rathayibacter sp. PhB152 TaxID=2485190 RepID=UPI000F4BFB23|nr:ATP-binding protein [Rathayibacter sp. PhB152]ROQ60523.1 AAA ATPase-like protein [Rathayibacter sp. PhB152]
MEPALNPYAPGSGLQPPALVGRESEINAFDLLVARSRAGRHSRGLVLHGLRGVGKTVLLNRFRSQAERAEWLLVDIEAQSSAAGKEAVRRKLGREISLAARRLYRGRGTSEAVRRALGTIRSFSAELGGVGFEIAVEPAEGRADSGRIDVDLLELVEDLVPALHERQIAFGVFIDEMQDLDTDLMAAIVAVQHRAGQREWPFYVTGAGLPTLPSTLSAARSYAERLFNYREIGPLDDSAARQALIDPARVLGASYETDASDLLVRSSRGYPYFLQTYGQAAWDLAIGRTITLDDAREALLRGNEELDMGFFPARWDRATPAERNYLTAMSADLGAPSSTATLADRLGMKTRNLSPARQSLIEKGIIYSPDRGLVAFTVPVMDEFVRRRSE